MKQTDVAVIGAGAAGLAAAYRLLDHGIDVVVLEARDRIGGRAYTVQSHDGTLPVELGAEFIHGAPQSTLTLMRACGESAMETVEQNFRLRDGLLEESPDFWETAERILQRVKLDAPDRSVEAFLASVPPSEASADELERIRAIVEGFDAAVTTDASIIAIAKEWRSGTNSTASRPLNGYAPMLHYLARSAHDRVLLQTRVDEIEWSKQGVRISAVRRGESVEIHAKCAIVTLPVGVLREQRVAFNPHLPAEIQYAIDAIAMGPVIKVVLEFQSRFWERIDDGLYRDAGFFYAPNCGLRTVWTRTPQRAPLLVAWAGGGAAQRVIARSTDPVAAALETCAALFPAVDVRAELRNAYHHDWQSDPFACGAYSFLRVGGGDARRALAAPVEQTLYFAGEATSSDDPGTVGGALDSGYRAANQIYS